METLVPKSHYEQIVRRFSQKAVLVIGDLMVDEYQYGITRRISPESPVMVVEIESDDCKPGGAANVVNNLLALGARVYAAGAVGEDATGEWLRAELQRRGADVSAIVTDPARPTTRKTRIVVQNQQVLRVDREKTHAISSPIADQLVAHFHELLPHVDAVLVSDYRKGLVTRESARRMVQHAHHAAKPLIANPKPSSTRWLAGAELISLNRSEAETLTGQSLPESEDAVRAYGAELVCELELQTLVITRGAQGLSYWRKDGEYRYVPAHAVEVYDVAGAGDTTISAMTLALVSGATQAEAAFIANHAGACVVRKAGVATVTPDELIEDWQP